MSRSIVPLLCCRSDLFICRLRSPNRVSRSRFCLSPSNPWYIATRWLGNRLNNVYRAHENEKPLGSMCAVFPTAKCRLRLLKLERIKDFLLLEKEYIRNQEVFKVSSNCSLGNSCQTWPTGSNIAGWLRPNKAQSWSTRAVGERMVFGHHSVFGIRANLQEQAVGTSSPFESRMTRT